MPGIGLGSLLVALAQQPLPAALALGSLACLEPLLVPLLASPDRALWR
jgi:uncharacterized MnhB-related membrane protein